MAKVVEILDDHGSVINTILVDDPAFAEEHYPGRWREIEPTAPDVSARPKLIITAGSVDADHAAQTLYQTGEITCLAGAILTFTAELRGPDDSIIPISDSFRMPMRSRDGREKILLVQMVDGVASITAPMRESGTWSVTEAAINEALPVEAQMEFAGVTVFVCEA